MYQSGRRLRNGAGDPALRWEVARDLALRTPESQIDVVATHKTHTILVIPGFQSGETSSIPGACVPPAAEDCSAINGAYPLIG